MKWTKQRLNNLFFLLGIAADVVMLLTFDVSFVELWQHLCHAGYWLIPIVGIWIVIYAMNALAWKAIIEGNIGGKALVSFWRIYRLTITGYALNYATPVGGLGGRTLPYHGTLEGYRQAACHIERHPLCHDALLRPFLVLVPQHLHLFGPGTDR